MSLATVCSWRSFRGVLEMFLDDNKGTHFMNIDVNPDGAWTASVWITLILLISFHITLMTEVNMHKEKSLPPKRRNQMLAPMCKPLQQWMLLMFCGSTHICDHVQKLLHCDAKMTLQNLTITNAHVENGCPGLDAKCMLPKRELINWSLCR